MIETKEFYDYLISKDIDFFAGVPDSLLKDFCCCVERNAPEHANICTANEGNAIAIASGYHISTNKYGLVYMQNSGIGNAVNPLVSLADQDVYKIPVLLLIGWRGEPGTKDEPQHQKQGEITLSLLECIGVRYLILGQDYKEQIDVCHAYMQKNSRPIALIVKKGVFSEYQREIKNTSFELLREEVLEEIVHFIDKEDFVVSTTGKTSRELYEIRNKDHETHGNDFLTVGSMGHTASLAFGISLGTSQNIYCIDGDGSFLMHMGSLGAAAQLAKSNFKYIMINNGAHESVGGAPTIGFQINMKQILTGLGFHKVYESRNIQELKSNLKLLSSENNSAMIVYVKCGSRKDLGRPDLSPVENKQLFSEKIRSISNEGFDI